MPIPISWIVIGIAVLIIITIIASGFVSASPGQIKVVSGHGVNAQFTVKPDGKFH